MKIDLTNLNASKKLRNLGDEVKEEIKNKTIEAKQHLLDVNKDNNDMTGWIDYPIKIEQDLVNDILATAEEVKSKCEVLLVIGIGGSYLGTKAVLEALNPRRREFGELKIVFAGFSLASSYTSYLLSYLEHRAFCINYVSKSGNTTEPAIAFRLFKNLLKKQHKSAYNDWIYVTTDEFNGNAIKEAKANHYKTFYIPSNIGGRYSCFTASALFPLACKDVDIKEFINGAKQARLECLGNEFEDNISMQYAYARNLCYKAGKQVEALCLFSPRLLSLSDWWRQLFAESEGKEGKGIFPVGMSYSTDLHSIGQFVQDGTKLMFETFIEVNYSLMGTSLEEDKDNYDGLNYLAGKDIHFINNQMLQATMDAHTKGLVPNIKIKMDVIDTYHLGKLMYFFMFACAMSAYVLGVNPFDQPAVSEYKNRMLELLKDE